MDHGIAVSLEGVNVQDASIQELALSSKYPIFKIAYSGKTTITIPSGDTGDPGYDEIMISHDLNYIPMFRCYGGIGITGTEQRPIDCMFELSSRGTYQPVKLFVRATETDLYIKGLNYTDAEKTMSIYYYIFVDPGA